MQAILGRNDVYATCSALGPRCVVLQQGLSAGLGLPPEVARDVMRAAALAASTTAHHHPGAGGGSGSGGGAMDAGGGGAGGGGGGGGGLPDDAAMRLALMNGISHTNTAGAAVAAGAAATGAAAAGATAAPGTDLAAAAAAAEAVAAGGAQTGSARGGVAGPGPGSAAAVAAATAAVAPGAEVSKVNLLKWLRRPSRTVQPKESFWIFCEVLLLLESCQVGGRVGWGPDMEPGLLEVVNDIEG